MKKQIHHHPTSRRKKKQALVYLGLGSNLKDKRHNLLKAIKELKQSHETKVIKQSSFYKTQPVGKPDQPDFLNAVVLIETSLKPKPLMRQLLALEKKLGRIRKEKWGPRIIDLDILFYNRVVIRQRNLIIPHPRLHQRRFVLEPLAEIAPNLVHPVLKQTIRDLLKH